MVLITMVEIAVPLIALATGQKHQDLEAKPEYRAKECTAYCHQDHLKRPLSEELRPQVLTRP
jgi:hypothetical protein